MSISYEPDEFINSEMRNNRSKKHTRLFIHLKNWLHRITLADSLPL